MLGRAVLLLASLASVAAGCLDTAATPAANRTVPAPAAVVVAEPTATGGMRLALMRRNDYLVAPVTIDGRPAGEFLVDTGAGATVIDRAVADELHLATVLDTSVQGALFT